MERPLPSKQYHTGSSPVEGTICPRSLMERHWSTKPEAKACMRVRVSPRIPIIMKYKFSLNQKVLIKMEDRWVGEYEAPGKIVGICPVFYNGVPTYSIQLSPTETLNEIVESRISNDKV